MDYECLNKLPPPNICKNIFWLYCLPPLLSITKHCQPLFTCLVLDVDMQRWRQWTDEFLCSWRVCNLHSFSQLQSGRCASGKWRKWVQSQVWCFGSWTLPWVHLNASLGDLLERLYRPGLHFLSPLCLRLMQIQHRHLASPHSPIYKLCIFDSRTWNAE